MRRYLPIATAVAAFTLAGCGTTAHHNSADVRFAAMMVPHHQQAIAMARLADGHGASPAVRALARSIADAQGPEIRTMTGWLKNWHMSAMPMQHDMPGIMSTKDMSALQRLSGSAFDRRFLAMMIAHHRGAVTMATTERRTGEAQAAVTLAGRIAASQTRQITTMRRMLSR